MEDKDIENIINKTLDERKKRTVAKIFHDPVKADFAFTMAMLVATISTVLLVAVLTTPGMLPIDNSFSEKILSKLGCQDLKDLYEEDLSYIEIQRYMFIKCL